MHRDEARLDRTREALSDAGLAALVCRLPENVVMLSGYWPVIGRSALIVPAEGEPVLLAPAMEEEALDCAWVREIRTFRVWRLGDPPPDESLAAELGRAAKELGLAGKRVGYEASFQDIAPTQKILEPWAPSDRRLLAEALAGYELQDASPLLDALRAVKTPYELERIRRANEIAAFGLEAFAAAVAPGRRESDVAAAVEAAVVARGTGYKGVRHARSHAVVFSGVARLSAWGWGFTRTSDRVINEGDLVMVEMATVADGYWSDLTRVRVAGRPTSEQREAFEAIREAQQAAIGAIAPGVPEGRVDAAARSALDRRGLGGDFVHLTGHGLGFRYHEGTPLLFPGAARPLASGMVTSVEPGIYNERIGGLRLEDNVVVTERGAERLSTLDLELG